MRWAGFGILLWDTGRGFDLNHNGMAGAGQSCGLDCAYASALGYRLRGDGMSPDKSGTRHFRQQRATAIANVPLVLFLLWFIVSHLGAARAEVVASVQNPFNCNPACPVICFHSLAHAAWHGDGA